MASIFVWTESSGEERALVTELDAEFLRPAHNRTRYQTESLDGSVFSVITIGNGQHMRRVALRHEPASQQLEDLRRAGEDRLTISVVPESTEQAVSYDVALLDFADVQREPQTGIGLQRFMMEFTARRLDGGRLP